MPMPGLPSGMFFRVKSGPFGIFPWVQLRRKVWIFSVVAVELADFAFDDTENMTMEDRIIRLAEMCLLDQEIEITTISDRDKYSGDYPPKELS